ncbi:MAG: type VI secretion system tip protein VgrG [Phormidesmis sp.]
MSDRLIPKNSVYDVATFTLLSDGKDITYGTEVISLSVTKRVNRIPTARIVCRDGSTAEETFETSESGDLIPGKEIEIALGYDGNDKTVFKGIVVKHSIKADASGDSKLILDCRDVAIATTISRHSRYFKGVKDSEALSTLLKDYSKLSSKLEATKVKHPELVQYYTTDWDFMLSRAEMNGQIVLVDDGKVSVKVPETSASPKLTLTYGANILEMDLSLDAKDQYAATEVKAWDYGDQKLVSATGKEPSVNQQGNLAGKKLAKAIDVKTVELRHGGLIEPQELQAWADAQLLKSRLGKVQGRIKIEGYQDAKPDDVIELEGMGDRFNGAAYISGIQHEMAGGVWTSQLHVGLNPQWFYKSADVVERPASGLLPGISGLQIGVVLQLQDDPTKDDRVLVKAPIIDEKTADGVWARVATLDAGEKRGSFFRPEIGDEVVLGFVNDDPRHPVILGMLNSSKHPAPLTAENTNHHKGFITRSEMKVLFDDEKKIMTLETPGGNTVVISDDEKSILLSDQTGNTVTLDSSGISLKSPKDISIEATGKLNLKATQDASLEGLNVNAKANTQFKATGNAGAEVSTPAIAVLKGSLVQIN